MPKTDGRPLPLRANVLPTNEHQRNDIMMKPKPCLANDQILPSPESSPPAPLTGIQHTKKLWQVLGVASHQPITERANAMKHRSSRGILAEFVHAELVQAGHAAYAVPASTKYPYQH